MSTLNTTPSTAEKFLDSAKVRTNRRWMPNVAKDFDELITNYDYSTVISNSRKLYANNGIVKGVIQQKATYSVGQAFLPQYTGEDKEWKAEATEWLRKWYKVADVSGWDFQTVLYMISVAIDRDGDAFVLLTSTREGYPQIQCIPSHQVGQRNNEKTVASGRYKGLKIRKGVIFQKNNRPVAYRVLGESQDQDQDISADRMIHIFDPEYFEQSRGLGLFSHALNQFRDMQDSTEKEMMAQLLMASVAFVEHNPFGGPDDSNPTVIYESTDGRPTCETYEEGTIKFFKSGDGSKLEPITNNRPSAEYQEFHNRLERIAIVGTGWSKALLDAAHGNGVADRIALRQGQRACEDRQSLLKPIAGRIISYAIAKAIKLELLPFNKDFYRWNFSTPPHISIDFGRDSSAIREEYKLGMRNLTDILQEQGKTLEEHLTQRAVEEAQAILIKREIETQYGVEIDPLKMRLNASNEFQPTTPTTQNQP